MEDLEDREKNPQMPSPGQCTVLAITEYAVDLYKSGPSATREEWGDSGGHTLQPQEKESLCLQCEHNRTPTEPPKDDFKTIVTRMVLVKLNGSKTKTNQKNRKQKS